MNYNDVVSLEEITTELSDGLHKAPVFIPNGEYIFVNAKNLVNGYIADVDPEKHTSYEEYCKYKSPIGNRTILYSIDGTIGNLARYRGEKCVLGKGACYINVQENIDLDYVYYVLQSDHFKSYIRQMSTGSTIKHISLKTMRNYKFVLPQESEQKKIAGILKSIDDKIETNTRINDKLEQQAQTIFRAWFMEYVPFGGALPVDWTSSTLGDICSCELGGTPSRAKPEYWNGNIPWINSGEVNRFRITKPSEMITELGLSQSATKLLPVKTTVIAITGATLGQVSLLEIASCANQSVVGVVPNTQLPYEFLYPFIKANIQELISHQTGGAQQHINKQNVESLPIVFPSKEVLKEYIGLVGGFYTMIANNCFENERLSGIRDSLLSRLISCEIDVSQIDI